MASASLSAFVFLFFVVLAVTTSGSSCLIAPFFSDSVLIESSDSSSNPVFTFVRETCERLTRPMSAMLYRDGPGSLLLRFGFSHFSVNLRQARNFRHI